MRFGFPSGSSVIVIVLLRTITRSVVQVASAPLAQVAHDYNLNLTASTIIASSSTSELDNYYSDNSLKQGTAATTSTIICVENPNKKFQFQGKIIVRVNGLRHEKQIKSVERIRYVNSVH